MFYYTYGTYKIIIGYNMFCSMNTTLSDGNIDIVNGCTIS